MGRIHSLRASEVTCGCDLGRYLLFGYLDPEKSNRRMALQVGSLPIVEGSFRWEVQERGSLWKLTRPIRRHCKFMY